MRLHYLDSSAWVKRYFLEAGSDRVHELFQGEEGLAGSWLGLVEVSAAISRQSGARRINASRRLSFESQLDSEWRLFLRVDALSDDFNQAVLHARGYALRGADALHLAMTLRLSSWLRSTGDELVFWTADRELLDASSASGLTASNPANS